MSYYNHFFLSEAFNHRMQSSFKIMFQLLYSLDHCFVNFQASPGCCCETPLEE